jgi:hypothetical protein
MDNLERDCQHWAHETQEKDKQTKQNQKQTKHKSKKSNTDPTKNGELAMGNNYTIMNNSNVNYI